MFARYYEACNRQYANWILIQIMTVNDDVKTAICKKNEFKLIWNM